MTVESNSCAFNSNKTIIFMGCSGLRRFREEDELVFNLITKGGITCKKKI